MKRIIEVDLHQSRSELFYLTIYPCGVRRVIGHRFTLRNAPLLSFCLKTRAGSAITSQEKDDPMETTMETAMERAKEAPEKQEVHLSRRLETPLRLDYRIPKAYSKDSNQVSGARLESQVQGRSLIQLCSCCVSCCVL